MQGVPAMDTSERLEISFLSQPLRISASLITPTGQEIFQNCFDGFNCPGEWVSALKAMAAATKSAQLNSASPPQHTSQGTQSPRGQRGFKARKRDRPSSIDDRDSDSSTRPSAPTRVLLQTFPTPAGSPGLASNPSTAASSPRDRPQTPASPAILDTRQVDRPFNDETPSTSNATATLSIQQRKQRLEARLQAISDSPIPSKEDFNDTIRRLYIEPVNTSMRQVDSKEQFAHVLCRLGNIASVQGVIYSLLSWLIFVGEEEKLIHDEGQALPVAAKRVNEMMAGVSNRRARTKDWASDGRRGARMVFESINGHSTAVQSFALLILAGNVTLDGLLKVAHFPLLREHFRIRFTQIVEENHKKWEPLVDDGYWVFDYKEFLHNSGATQIPLCPRTRSNTDPAAGRTASVTAVQPVVPPSNNNPGLFFTDLYTPSEAVVSNVAQLSSALSPRSLDMFDMETHELPFERIHDFGLLEPTNTHQSNVDFANWYMDHFQDMPMFGAA